MSLGRRPGTVLSPIGASLVQDISGNLRRLRLTVHSAKGLVSSDVTGVSDPYCIVVPILHDGTEVTILYVQYIHTYVRTYIFPLGRINASGIE